MATRLYLHAATDSTTGLPTAEQHSSFTADKNMEGSQTTNRQMTTTIGTSQTSISGTPAIDTLQELYFTRFVSPPIFVSSISANTWTYNFSTSVSHNGTFFPVELTDATEICCYVWRPSTTTKIGTILQGFTAANLDGPSGTVDVQKAHHTTFSGSAVASTASTDVIIFEVWFQIDPSVAGSTGTVRYFYDGTTVNTTDNATVSNHASFLETPQNILAPTTLAMTEVSALTYANKVITKV